MSAPDAARAGAALVALGAAVLGVTFRRIALAERARRCSPVWAPLAAQLGGMGVGAGAVLLALVPFLPQ